MQTVTNLSGIELVKSGPEKHHLLSLFCGPEDGPASSLAADPLI